MKSVFLSGMGVYCLNVHRLVKFEAAGCPLRDNSEPEKALQKYDHRRKLILAAKKTPEAKKRKMTLRNERRKMYAQARRKNSNPEEYRRFQLDEALQQAHGVHTRVKS